MNVKNFEKKYRETIEQGESVAHNLATKPNESMWFDWNPYMNQEWWILLIPHLILLLQLHKDLVMGQIERLMLH